MKSTPRDSAFGSYDAGMKDLFDAEAMYDDDYLHFLAPTQETQQAGGGVHDLRSDADVEVIWGLLDLQPGMAVLDVGCGYAGSRIGWRRGDAG